MAISKLVEPYVISTERIHETPNLLNIDASSNIGGVIVAPTGPRLAFISGPKDFLDNYTVDGEIPRNADITFINAYYLSFSAGLVIARAMNTTAVAGLWFSHSSQKETKLLLNLETDGLWGIQFGDVYYWCNNSDEVFNDFIDTITNMTNDEGEYLYNSDKINAIKSAGSNNCYCADLDALASNIAKNLGKDFSAVYSESVGGVIISSATSEVTQAVNKSTTIQIAYELTTGEEVNGLEGHEILYKDNVALTESETLTFNFGEKGVSGNWAFVYGTLAYYHGAIDRSKYDDYSLKSVSSLDDIASSINGINGMAAEANEQANTITVTFSKGNRLYIDTEMYSGDIEVTQDTSDDAVTSSYNDMNENMLFAIYPNTPQDNNLYKMIVSPDDGELFQISLYNGETTNTYTVSIYPDAVDQSGANAYVDNLSAIEPDFNFVVNSNISEADALAWTPKLDQVFSFGDSGLDLSSSKSTTSKINALYALEDQELYDIEYLAPFGETNLQFIKNYVNVGKNNQWFTPVDIPKDKTNANSIKGYFLNVDLTSNAIGMGPFDKNTGLTGWTCYIACSTLYYTKVMNNKAANSEFAPCFDITNGILDFTNPVYMLGKEDREKLLNFKAPVNFLLYDMRSNVYYLNDNWTHQSERNIVSEEQNRRIVNKIRKDCVKLMKRFKGRFNTESTRSDVRSLLSYYMDNNLMNQNYAPNEYEIVCDETNNTTEIINSNQLAVTVRVRLYNAIKYITVLADVYPIGVDFTN